MPLLKCFAKVVAITVALILFAEVQAGAQALPGPASEGWFVLMGRYKKEMKHASIDTCIAHLVPSIRKDLERIRVLSPPPFEDLAVTRRFGPFPTEDAALEALKAAGWDCGMKGVSIVTPDTICSASSGCD